MKYCVALLLFLTAAVFEMKAEVDPKFQIYLCFGQSNMEGGSPAEPVDMEYVDERFKTFAARDFESPARSLGNQYTAYPPIASDKTVLGVADYFGRSMVAALPADYRVGVVDVAVGGTKIQAFISEMAKDYMEPGRAYIKKYGGNLYKRLVYTAKIAQQSGVIKGILLHQGEANCGDPQWLEYVQTIYNRLIVDLGLNAAEVPLLAGEVVNASENGQCAAHNEIIAQLPSRIPTAHVISSYRCPCDAVGLHFSSSGYRIMGKRYAIKMLELLGYPAHKDANYQLHESLRRFYKATHLDTHIDIDLLPGSTYNFKVTAYFEDGHNEDVTAEVVVTSTGDGLIVNGTQLTAVTGESSLVTVRYTDFTGEIVSTSFYVNKSALKNTILKANDYTREYGELNPAFGYTVDGDNIEGEPDVYCDATATSPVGTYPIRISRGSISDENVDYVDGTLTITKAPITITANSYTRVEGDPNPPFEVTYSGFKNGETDAVLTQMPTVTTTATMDSEVGTYDIEASGAEAQNYTFNYVKGILTITERKVLITIDGITYEGLNSLSAAEVVAFDQSEDSLTILETVSDNGKNYRVTSIGRRAFYKCGGIKSVVLPNSIMTINRSAFEDCSSLTSVSLGDGLTYIGGSAFEDCVMLPSITIPNSVTSIALNAFKNCPGLKSVYSEIDIPFEITSDVFSTISPDAELIVPDGTRTIYQNTSGWDVFSKITEVSSMGIDAILFFTNDIQDVTIYSLSGQLVGRTKQKDIDGVWQQLPKGVYVVNGKKKIK